MAPYISINCHNQLKPAPLNIMKVSVDAKKIQTLRKMIVGPNVPTSSNEYFRNQ